MPVITCEMYEILSQVEAESLGQFVFQAPFTYKARALIWALYVPQIHTTLRDWIYYQFKQKYRNKNSEISLRCLPCSPSRRHPAAPFPLISTRKTKVQERGSRHYGIRATWWQTPQSRSRVGPGVRPCMPSSCTALGHAFAFGPAAFLSTQPAKRVFELLSEEESPFFPLGNTSLFYWTSPRGSIWSKGEKCWWVNE